MSLRFYVAKRLYSDLTVKPQAVIMKDMLDKWSQTGEFRNVPEDKFVATMRAAQKDRSTSDTALFMCWRRYSKNNPPPTDLINVLLEAPTDFQLGFRQHWARITRLYLDVHKISAERGSVLLLKASRAGCLPVIFGKLKDNLSQDVWMSLVLAVRDAKRDDRLMIGLGLRKCKDNFDAESVKYIHGLVKTRNPKKLAPLIADVLPNDLSVVTRWMSLCEAQKRDVAARLLRNMMMYTGPPVNVNYWQSRLDDVSVVRQEATNLARAWLDIYQASLYAEIGGIFWRRGNEKFKIGLVETAAEKEEFDSLEAWLEDPDSLVVGKDKLLCRIRNDKDGERRKDGHIWHTKLAKALYESNTFKSVEVEYEISGRGSQGDILLEDEHGRDIHIEASIGMTELAHKRNRRLLTGEWLDINRLGRRGNEDADSEREYVKLLNEKVKQLPKTGRNFVIAQCPDGEPKWQSMDGVDLKDNTCAIQIVPPSAHVWCKDMECMGATAKLISESLGDVLSG